MALVTTRIAIDTCLARHKFYGLSFFGDNGLTVEEIAFMAGLPNPKMRVSTVGKLRSRGFEPFRSREYPHLTLRFEINPTDDELETLIGLFDGAIPNPAKNS